MEVKWIKVATDMFDNRKIKQLESKPNADTLIVIWIKLLALAGRINNGGKLMLTEKEKYTDKSLAVEFGRSDKVVAQAMKLFCSLDMVAKDKGVYTILNWEKYQNAEAMEEFRAIQAQKKREYRAKKSSENKAENDVLDKSWTSLGQVQDCPKRKTTERKEPKERIIKENQEKEEDKEREFKDRGIGTPPCSLEDVKTYCLENKINVDADIFFNFYSSNGWLVGNQTPMRDWKACVRTWAKRETEKAKAEKKQPHTFAQHDYSEDEINGLFTDLEALAI